MSAVSARTSQLPMLLTRAGQARARSSQFVLLSADAPPFTKIARTTQEVMLAVRSAEANLTTFNSQQVMLVAYKTGIPDPKRSRAWSFVLDGHTFYVLDLGEEGTFLFDDQTEQWTKFETAGYGQWNFQNGCMWGTRIVGGDLLTDQVWELVPSAVLDEEWRDIEHVVTGKLTTRSRVYLGCDAVRVAGSIGTIDQVNGATMSLRYSDDDGKTWSDYFTVDLTTDPKAEIAFRSLGSFMAPGRVFELSDVGGLVRIDGADAFINGFDDDAQPGT